MPAWLTSEIKTLREVYRHATLDQMQEMLPRHTKRAIAAKGCTLCGRTREERHLGRVRMAHEHFQRREQGLLK